MQQPISDSYAQRRGQLETYFNRTAVDAWKRLTSDVPVSGIRATVRAGRDTMRGTLLGWLPDDLRGYRLLDAGCGTGAFASEAASRGADVVGVDISETLVELARERQPADLAGSIELRVGDMLSADHGDFDYVVAMDSLIHYGTDDVLGALRALAPRVRVGMLITFAPSTPALAAMHAVGRLFPRGDRAPAIQPVAARRLQSLIATDATLSGWQTGRTERVSRGFYTSQALEVLRK
ncbi:magnesium-protoporphyrin O-methyltransferase [Natronocella acetinitrilica]|uniref:Magnesium protoporphyrin IX methyltransferase n=1 Tax=Natronocella acetinitrilica TaxID=414046 RepID=A0AAE3KH14_9GAMM|nr:magnesium protoporphyrin IX methyltransferase [Natronocella acetinitrilica]MCP1675862.1 magnesium-protoporphyrin O-methyltransferase [Natronocella acetinitrilica]